jgi:hypothetical protein
MQGNGQRGRLFRAAFRDLENHDPMVPTHRGRCSGEQKNSATLNHAARHEAPD